ncbi:MAG: FliA/WhiG family RNA polymerase sigma factor [Chloroflexota bacterium]|nr:FliA/WhiG family RNA polymerase sigma factor [Chloroflexota bacterium]
MSIPTVVEDIWAEFVVTKRQALRDTLVIEYTPLVRMVVGRMGIPATSMLEAEDLVSYGMIGLLNALDRFDPSRGVRFETFASTRIRGAVIDQLRALNWMPRSTVARVKQIETTLAYLEQRLGRPAKEQEAAAELGVSTEHYRQMLQDVTVSVISLDAPLSSSVQDDEVATLGHLLEDTNALEPAEEVEKQELTAALSSAIDHLPERERLLLSLYYQEELTMKEISKVMGVSESRVCQLHMQAVLRLRGGLQIEPRDAVRRKKERRVMANGSKGSQLQVHRAF